MHGYEYINNRIFDKNNFVDILKTCLTIYILVIYDIKKELINMRFYTREERCHLFASLVSILKEIIINLWMVKKRIIFNR
ncbi:hypothetical protein [Plasmodium yoelii yoelii]|uniref:Uncharacterized protein n=1 Tax=Plasmodium yoelii yoelii TaxID=73239 RepID=Q7RM09_PLAYO|nr:hypothetical protein [Plasmodium yoelii yoelii]